MLFSGSSSTGMVYLPEHVRCWSLTWPQPVKSCSRQRTHCVICAIMWCCKKLGAKVRVRVAVSILAKASFQKAFVSHCMEFLAVFHSQCLSAGTRPGAKQEEPSKRNRVQHLVLLRRQGAVLYVTLTGMGQKPEDATVHTERGWRHKYPRSSFVPEIELWVAKGTGQPLEFPHFLNQ